MKIYQFLYTLNDELYNNGFYIISLNKEYSEHDETYLIRIIAKRENKKYDYRFSVKETFLDNNSIQEIINCLLMGVCND